MSRMRGKPDLSSISPLQKDPTAFLEGAREDRLAPPPDTELPPVPTVQKLFRIRWDIAKALKKAAIAESSPTRRMTETEIVERLLKQYLKIDK